MTTTEKNKLIAEFISIESPFNKGHYICPNGIATKPEDMKFHSSWDWLMPVVEKIESLGNYGFTIYRNSTNINGLPIELANTRGNTKIEAVYNACVEFILWYNENPA